MPRYYRYPWAENGNREEVPDTLLTDAVNYEFGYTPAYSLPKDNPDRRNVDREPLNGALYDITSNLKFWQENAYPEIVEDAGDGNPVSYPLGFVGIRAGVKYQAIVNGTDTVPPSAQWRVYQIEDAAFQTVMQLLEDIGTPAGTLIHFGGNTPPEGYLACDGSAVSRVTYSRLFDAIGTRWGAGNGSTTFNLPDGRGEFLRGWDNGRGVDSGRAFASSQSFAIQSHDHDMLFRQGSEAEGGVTDRDGFLGIFSDTDRGQYRNEVAVQNTGGSETRPRNIATLICIKF